MGSGTIKLPTMSTFVRILAAIGLFAVGWVLVTAGAAVVHGHPAYAILLVLTVLGCAVALWLHRHRRPIPRGWRVAGSIALTAAAIGWLAAIVWLRPYPAQEPALAAMQSDADVVVTESATRIVMEPTGVVSATAMYFQPGARVEGRAYAAVLRPLAEAGHRVVIVKQPLSIAFLSLGTFASVRDSYPDISSWVLGGHSLGGTVAVMEADDNDEGGGAGGLILYASYPAGDVRQSLLADVVSISGTNDGLATPADIEASRADLPAAATFTIIDGAVHSFFGDYGPQSGDGVPGISHDEARAQISERTVQFVDEAAGPARPS